jgi:hypothetical protein
LRVEHDAKADGSRLRVIYVASPIDDTGPKSVPDEESLRAAYLDAPGVTLRWTSLIDDAGDIVASDDQGFSVILKPQ